MTGSTRANPFAPAVSTTRAAICSASACARAGTSGPVRRFASFLESPSSSPAASSSRVTASFAKSKQTDDATPHVPAKGTGRSATGRGANPSSATAAAIASPVSRSSRSMIPPPVAPGAALAAVSSTGSVDNAVSLIGISPRFSFRTPPVSTQRVTTMLGITTLEGNGSAERVTHRPRRPRFKTPGRHNEAG